MHRAGFEPAPPKRKELESSALDHSANDAQLETVLIVLSHIKDHNFQIKSLIYY